VQIFNLQGDDWNRVEQRPGWRYADAFGADVDMPAAAAGRVVIAIFRDPAGNRIGLVRG
jgi:hypothetical protein